jgi:hypothetical protein
MGNLLIYFGVVLIIIGVVMNIFSRFSPPLLPGDIFIRDKNFTFYFPLTTSLILSIILAIILNLFNKR